MDDLFCGLDGASIDRLVEIHIHLAFAPPSETVHCQGSIAWSEVKSEAAEAPR
ncbi:hypothetical protein [Sinimarinibacterium sp. NLF-5-8]|uniref:hypothetical protein n=1 Tax=Sinimarinibacterium sp. NLF-5-8 TaxID=2698684 RepID=UPI00137C18B6|nr:hypothetical protein [Sinimarinibacterium sp. NLF-5-8]QHS11156.1 hypothetical protein GT972_14075 [Sinimarinibacterium sp. NLF-5-8]